MDTPHGDEHPQIFVEIRPSGHMPKRPRAHAAGSDQDAERERAERQRVREALRRGRPEPEPTLSSPALALDAQVRVDHHCLALNGIDPDLNDIAPALRPINRLTGATDSGLMLFTGVASGPVRMHVQAAVAEPEVDLDEWETVVEVPIETPEGRILFSALFGDVVPGVNLATAGPGSYQVRVGNRGFDVAYDLAATEPVEDMLVQVWPSASPRTRVLKGV